MLLTVDLKTDQSFLLPGFCTFCFQLRSMEKFRIYATSDMHEFNKKVQKRVTGNGICVYMKNI